MLRKYSRMRHCEGVALSLSKGGTTEAISLSKQIASGFLTAVRQAPSQ